MNELTNVVVVMVSQTTADNWKIEALTTNQNGDNIEEVEWVRSENRTVYSTNVY